jgi:hypothetical protein
MQFLLFVNYDFSAFIYLGSDYHTSSVELV